MPAQQDAARALIACLRSVMRREEGLADRVEPVRVDDAAAFLAAVERHRVAQVLAPHTDALALPAAAREGIRALAARSVLAGMRTATGTMQVSAILANEDVAHLVIKGAALAQQTTGSPAGRGGGDIDLLVAPASVPAAVAVLERAGILQDRTYAPVPQSPLFPATLRTQQELLLHHQGVEVDLHWRLDCGRGCLAWPFDMLLADAQTVTLGGSAVPTLSRRHAAIANASNATRDAWSSLRSIVDHLRLVRGLDTAALRLEARHAGAARRFELAGLLAARLLAVDPPAAGRSTQLWAERIWQWLQRGVQPAKQPGVRAAARLQAANYLTYDAPRSALTRAGTVVWPVKAMAARDLGTPGDRHPWVYPAAAPYFVPRRALARAGVAGAYR